MSDREEDTNPSANVPLWIEHAVSRAMGPALRAIDEGCAAREARMLESENRIIAALAELKIGELRLMQQASEASLLVLSDKLDALRVDVEDLKAWRRDTERCPPPGE
jgi:hypothetical protein